MRKRLRPGLLASLLSTVIIFGDVWAQDTYRVDSREQWESWTFPPTTLDLNEDGSITPAQFEPNVNASLDATEWTHSKTGGDRDGGIRVVNSGQATALNLIDGDLSTYWQPDPDSDLADWELEIDLGRVIPATMIRLHFPDQEGARPLREFRLFATDATSQSSTNELYLYDLVGGVTKFNEETVLEFPLSSGGKFKNRVHAAGAPAAETDTTTEFVHLQYVTILPDAKSTDAAISEVEVITYAENIAVGLIERGGIVSDQDLTGRASTMIDGDVNSGINVNIVVGQKAGGIRYDWDLGAVYFVSRALFLGGPFGSVARLLSSDGRLAPTPAPPGEDPIIDYDIEFDFVTETAWASPHHLTYLFHPYKRMRYLSLDWDLATGGRSVGALNESAIYPVGHVAEVRITSDFLPIADRAKVLKSLSWEADLPEGTRILAATRSGNTFETLTLYYDRNGVEVSEDTWNGLRKSKRGPTDDITVPGSDWSAWSNTYQFSGQQFLSPSPRQYVQFRVMMATESPDTAPTLRALELEMADALLSGATAHVTPNRAVPGEAATFTYTLAPSFRRGDTGFNRILVLTPAQAALDSLEVRVEGERVEPVSVRNLQDSLIVELDAVVERSEVELDINVPILENPYLFNGFVGHTDEPGLWQLVDESERFAVTVFLPDIAEANDLIDDLTISPRVVTPNGDGVGDQAVIRFAVFKTETPAEVRIYSMAGELVGEVAGGTGADGMQEYTWPGTDLAGTRVAPGIYLCRVRLDAQVNEEIVARVINVAY